MAIWQPKKQFSSLSRIRGCV